MKRLINSIILFLVLIIQVRTYAAFPATAQQPTAKEQHISRKEIKEIRSHFKAPADVHNATEDSGIFGIISFISSLTALILIALNLWAGALLLIIAAIVLGAIGINKPKRGFAIAGLIIGMTELLVLILVALFWLAFFSWWV